MSWSLLKELALRSLRPVGQEYAMIVGRLSEVDDLDVPSVVRQIEEERHDAAREA